MNSRGHDKPRGRGTALAGREEGAVQRRTDRDIKVGVINHNHGVLAAHFQLNLLAAGGAINGNLSAGGNRAGEADSSNVLMFDDPCADF